MKFTILKGWHAGLSWPPITFFSTVKGTFQETWKFKFSEINKYSITDVTMPWNKLLGYKGLYFTPMFDTVMVGWRWNNITNLFQCISYYHLGSSAHTYDEPGKVLDIPMDAECTATVTISNGKTATVALTCDGKTIIDSREFSKSYSKFYRITTWFGGKEASPKHMTLTIDKI
jgi:hypothetical protein